ncbi:ATP-dependent DNA ligase [Aquimonas voraii]|uniref:DNA ligase (ATP) n=1 Tax=Aquimonas voraii TaxID=265719 RepID=A0A1G6UC87_9GAMM|nr:ATP-dependent DNA ligase [Aquimonas voraii]SDD38988.1 DNA ligase-1 [Aquimonas voraii]
MRAFAELYREIEGSTSLKRKREALVAYFQRAEHADAAWALHVLLGRKLARIATSGELRAWVCDASGLAPWLVEDSYAHVGDLAETLSLLLPEPSTPPPKRALSSWVEDVLLPLRGAAVETRQRALTAAWAELPELERLVFNKLLTGALRIGVSAGLVQQALAQIAGVDAALIAQRLLGDWTPAAEFMARVLAPADAGAGAVAIQPFQLASPLEDPPETLGPIEHWQLEWKWDGIRAQLLRSADGVVFWSRGEERLDGRFPELEAAALRLPEGCLLDGEILAWKDGAPLPFVQLQKRINRLKPGPKLLAECPLRFLAYDALFVHGEDLRAAPLSQRRAALDALLTEASSPRPLDASAPASAAAAAAAPGTATATARPPATDPAERGTLGISPQVQAATWRDAEALRASARERGVEGLMLKRADSPWQPGRKRGAWWKWKLDPLSIDAVLIYAQAGHGRRATLYTDYTFALWDGAQLLPVAKAYSGLDEAEILRLDRWIRANTLERFGPVRSVRAELVFELGFEGVNLSSRHKSGVALRFPRILRWREDKLAREADQLSELRRLAERLARSPSEAIE